VRCRAEIIEKVRETRPGGRRRHGARPVVRVATRGLSSGHSFSCCRETVASPLGQVSDSLRAISHQQPVSCGWSQFVSRSGQLLLITTVLGGRDAICCGCVSCRWYRNLDFDVLLVRLLCCNFFLTQVQFPYSRAKLISSLLIN
jgi:hypothetical protein